jgi:outer membrane biosynthesis protein TonB
VFSNLGLNWPRRQTLAFVAFAAIIVAFTALALSWNGLSAFKNSARADPQLGPFMIAISGRPTPTPTPRPQVTKHPTGVTTVSPVQRPSPKPSPKATPGVKATTKHKATPKPKATHTPKPVVTPTPKPKLLYVHTPKFVHVPKRKAQYPPAAPPANHYGVLSGVAGRNYTPR